MSNLKRKYAVSIFTLLFFDIVSFYLSLSFAYFLRKTLITRLTGIEPISFKALLSHFWMPLIFIFFMFFEELYSKRRPFFSELRNILRVVFFTTVIIFAVVAVSKVYIKVSRVTIILFGIILSFLLPLVRRFVKYILYKFGLWKAPGILIVRDDDFNISEIDFGFYTGYFVDRKIKLSELKKEPLEGKVLIFLGFSEKEFTIDDLSYFISKRVKELIFLSTIETAGFLNYEILYPVSMGRIALLVSNNLLSPSNMFLKSAIDILLLFLIFPFFLFSLIVISILIKLDSKGRVIFSQERVGKGGKLFKYYKFRTMYENSDKILEEHLERNPDRMEEWNRFKKLKGYDPRITKIGKFLRTTSLDELPQIINVLKGEMSFVGPRPYLKREIDEMGEYYSLITKVKPGITGLWQVSGRNELEFKERLKIDAFYIKNWSIWLDLIIIIKTIKTVIKKEGAY